MKTKLPSLHQAIRLPKDHESEAMVEFVTRYIEHVPDFIDALTELSQEAGIYESTKRFLIIVEDFFLHPPELTQDHKGLEALIDEAYLAHRLFEEINDRLMMKIGGPLAPMDMTRSNIIIHSLLGEEFANQLDLAVHYSIECLFQNDALLNNRKFRSYINHCNNHQWHKTLEQWPCLAGDLSIELTFDRRRTTESLH